MYDNENKEFILQKGLLLYRELRSHIVVPNNEDKRDNVLYRPIGDEPNLVQELEHLEAVIQESRCDDAKFPRPDDGFTHHSGEIGTSNIHDFRRSIGRIARRAWI